MRYEKGHRAETSARIVDRASARIRERGVEGVKVAGLMKAAGLTHGGFYLHFKSRSDLIERAFARAMNVSVEQWRKLADRSSPGERLLNIVDYYLTDRHRDDVANGCALPALGAEVSRTGAGVRRTFSNGLREMIAILSEDMNGPSKREAIAIVSEIVGALLLARAADHREFASEIMSVAREHVLGNERQLLGTTKASRKSSVRTRPPGSKRPHKRKRSNHLA
ncbi:MULTISPECIES: TetR/AcrR family transcriptional regulator [Bradyrhizobium]|jgi:TetR/AcrR family transcriptional regulator, transcriptional repressor for nem operon|uniref:TetR/AcrR family transcriptional regulator n=1 Tax=Bradyrhizobium TaxID=374 RepID=UPI00293ED7B3|nr:TetR/AcrR family transcriptional regulator [Bradyrhizobium sp. NDS-1]WOH71393.1 TetR/AcrR family transcriptional regulator [Bradyrhizobium sp. NDS-1]